jgi:hypothetical protein
LLWFVLSKKKNLRLKTNNKSTLIDCSYRHFCVAQLEIASEYGCNVQTSLGCEFSSSLLVSMPLQAAVSLDLPATKQANMPDCLLWKYDSS